MDAVEITYPLPGLGKKLTIRLMGVDARMEILKQVARAASGSGSGEGDAGAAMAKDVELSRLACLVAYDGKRVGQGIGPSELLRTMPPKAIGFLDAAIKAEHDVSAAEVAELMAGRVEGGAQATEKTPLGR